MPPSSNRLVYAVLRRTPLPLVAVVLGIACGVLVWATLDRLQHQALQRIFHTELQTQLDRQARASLIGFGHYINLYQTATRLLANHRRLFLYFEPLIWFYEGPIERRVYRDWLPPWLPQAVFQKLQIYPTHILLLDNNGVAREIFSRDKQILPSELRRVDEFFLSESQVKPFLTALEGLPYLFLSSDIKDASGQVMGFLMLVVAIDDGFLRAAQEMMSDANAIVALVDADEERVLASSDPLLVSSGQRLTDLDNDYLVTAQSFFEHNDSDLNLQYATLMPRVAVEAMESRVLDVDKRENLIAAITFVSAFTLLMFLISLRLSQVMRRISLFSQLVLGYPHPVLEDANPLFRLDEWVEQFIDAVLASRKEMRERHATEMRETEMLKNAILDNSLDPIIATDAAGAIVEFNPTAERVLGYLRSDVIGKDFSTLMVGGRDRTLFRQRMDGCLVDDSAVADEERIEISVLRADGSPVPVETAIMPILLRSRLVFTIYMHDISRRKKAQMEVSSLAKLASESPNPVLRANRRGVIIYANAACEPILSYWGCAPGQTLPLYWRNRVSYALERGRQEDAELVSEELIFSLLLVPILEFDYVNLYGRDITLVRRAEQQARQHQAELVHVCRLSTMGEMATGLAHELNQPLSAIVNYASGCTRRLQNGLREREPLIGALSQITNQAERAGDIIRRLRGLVSKQPPIRQEVDINDLVIEVCSFVEYETRRLGIDIVLELNERQLCVNVDYVQIEQVLLNLLRNAMDALYDIPQERRKLAVYTGAEGESAVIVAVEDSGQGISEQVKQRLFDPFFTTKNSGMGMGLPISQTIINDHKGRITVDSEPGKGARFEIVLPAHSRSAVAGVVG